MGVRFEFENKLKDIIKSTFLDLISQNKINSWKDINVAIKSIHELVKYDNAEILDIARDVLKDKLIEFNIILEEDVKALAKQVYDINYKLALYERDEVILTVNHLAKGCGKLKDVTSIVINDATMFLYKGADKEFIVEQYNNEINIEQLETIELLIELVVNYINYSGFKEVVNKTYRCGLWV